MARKALGAGLQSYFGDKDAADTGSGTSPGSDGVRHIPLADIAPDPDQPRKRFVDEDLDELATSIRNKGLLQPVLVRKAASGPAKFILIAGERRWRAAARAGLHDLPALVREADDTETAELALIENVQRSDLNPMEEADAYARLRDTHGRKVQDIADTVGKSRSHVSNMLRLVGLPQDVRAEVAAGHLSMGHARALLMAKDPVSAARKVIDGNLSVRETEKLVSAENAEPASSERRTGTSGSSVEQTDKDADTKSLETSLENALGLSVAIEHGKNGGTVTLTYDTLEQLDDICRRLTASRS